MRTPEGFFVVVALGCVLKFATPLRRDRYGPDYDPLSNTVAYDLEEENLARMWFRVIMKTFATKYLIVIKDTIIHTSYIWESVIVGFAAVVVTHMKHMKSVVEVDKGRTPENVAKALTWHLQQDYSHLVQPLIRALVGPDICTSLTWNRPPIEIKRKTYYVFYPMLCAVGLVEAVDWEGAPLHAEGVSKDEHLLQGVMVSTNLVVATPT